MINSTTQNTSQNSALRKIAERGGIIRTAEALRAGIHPRTLYALRDRGVIEQISRGVYRIPGYADDADPDLITVAKRCPHAVICLTSALAIHELTTQVPHSVHIAIARGAEAPRIGQPPLTVFHFSRESHAAGIASQTVNGIEIRVYNPEKTLADCFKFRNRIGMDIVLESLKLYRERRPFNAWALLDYARICRVENVMRPYLEAIA